MIKFEIHTLETAPEKSMENLKISKKGAGFIPNMHGIMAESPVLLKAYKDIGRIFNESSFSPIEREIIEMITNQINGCTYCIAAHSYFDRLDKFPEDILKALLANKSLEDPKLQTLRLFTKTVVENRGSVTAKELDMFFLAGYSKEQVMELIVGIAHKTMSNYINHIAETPVDTQFE